MIAPPEPPPRVPGANLLALPTQDVRWFVGHGGVGHRVRRSNDPATIACLIDDLCLVGVDA